MSIIIINNKMNNIGSNLKKNYRFKFKKFEIHFRNFIRSLQK